MEQFTKGESTREEIKNKLRQNFDGKMVRKDLTKKIKEGANVPVYVLEFLLGQYCSSDDGIWLFCSWQRRKGSYCFHGLCGKHQSECGCAVENIQFVCTVPAGNGNRHGIS